jgi:septum formation protein
MSGGRPLIIPAPARELVLASSSPYRRRTLESLGLEVRTVAPDFDERAFSSHGMAPDQLALALARGKARSVCERLPGTWVLAGDQLAHLDGRILGKPGGIDAAVAQLLELSGRTHELITALVLMDADSGRFAERLHLHRMSLRRLEEASLRDYVERDQPVDCAGSYRIESLGVALFDSMEGSDHSAIVGLPVTALVSLLEEALGWTELRD